MASGFNVVDFMDLPPAERCLVRLLLRQESLSYPEIREEVATMPTEQRFDDARLDSALDHLTQSDWLIRQSANHEITYRVNAIQRSGSQNQGLWDGIDLDSIDSALPYDVDLYSDEIDRPMKRGGKRMLPHHIWDCLAEPAESPAELPPRRPARRAGLLDTLTNSEDDSDEK